jgi:hypothetical protein
MWGVSFIIIVVFKGFASLLYSQISAVKQIELSQNVSPARRATDGDKQPVAPTHNPCNEHPPELHGTRNVSHLRHEKQIKD